MDLFFFFLKNVTIAFEFLIPQNALADLKGPKGKYNCTIDGKVQVGNDQEMVQSERNSHSINRELEKLYQENIL